MPIKGSIKENSIIVFEKFEKIKIHGVSSKQKLHCNSFFLIYGSPFKNDEAKVGIERENHSRN